MDPRGEMIAVIRAKLSAEDLAWAAQLMASRPDLEGLDFDPLVAAGVDLLDHWHAFGKGRGGRGETPEEAIEAWEAERRRRPWPAEEDCPTCPSPRGGPHKMSCSSTKGRLTLPVRFG